MIPSQALPVFATHEDFRQMPNHNESLVFTPITQHQPGIIFSLLRRSYAPIWNGKFEDSPNDVPSLGFREIRRFTQTPDSECQTIEYQIDLK